MSKPDTDLFDLIQRVAVNPSELDKLLIDEQQKVIALLKKQRNEAVNHLAAWAVAIDVKGSSWDDWDKYYKDVIHRENALPSIRDHLNIAIEKERKTYER